MYSEQISFLPKLNQMFIWYARTRTVLKLMLGKIPFRYTMGPHREA